MTSVGSPHVHQLEGNDCVSPSRPATSGTPVDRPIKASFCLLENVTLQHVCVTKLAVDWPFAAISWPVGLHLVVSQAL